MPITALISEDTSPVLAFDTKFADAMKILGVSRSTMYRIMKRSNLSCCKVGSTWRLVSTELRSDKVMRPSPIPKIA